jgi:hypothetical protein
MIHHSRMDWTARGIGGCYAVAGLIALRYVLINWWLDRKFATVVRTSPTELTADVMLATGAVLLIISGLALSMLHPWTIPAFIVCWAAQAVYLLWAQRWFRPQGVVSARGRRDTVHAFAVYSLATTIVIGLPLAGVLD